MRIHTKIHSSKLVCCKKRSNQCETAFECEGQNAEMVWIV